MQSLSSFSAGMRVLPTADNTNEEIPIPEQGVMNAPDVEPRSHYSLSSHAIPDSCQTDNFYNKKNYALLIDRLLELSLPLPHVSEWVEDFNYKYYVTHLEEEIDRGRASIAGMEFARKIGVASKKVLIQLGVTE